MEEKIKELIAASCDTKSCAHGPYSHFRVGAALLTTEGRVFTGASMTRPGGVEGVGGGWQRGWQGGEKIDV